MAERKRATSTEKPKTTRKTVRKTATKTISKQSAAPEVTQEPKTVSKSLTSLQTLFQDSWQLFKTTFLPYLKLFLVGVALFLTIGVIGLLLSLPLMISSGGSADALFDSPSFFQVVGIVLVLVWAIASVVAAIVYLFLMQIARIFIVDKKEQLSVEELFKKSKPFLLPFFVANVIVGALVLGGWVLFIIPGLLFFILFSLVSFVVVLEGKKGRAALEQSYQLVRSNFWPFVGRVLLLQVILYVASTALENLAKQADIFSLVSFVFSVLSGWFAQIYMYLLYKQLRDSKVSHAPVNLKWVWIVAGIGWLIIVGVIISLATGRIELPQLDDAIKMMETAGEA